MEAKMKVTNCLYCGGEDLTHVTHRSDDNGILRCERCMVMMVENISNNTEGMYTAEYFEKSEDTKSGYTNYLSSPAANIIGKYGFARLFAREPGNHLDLGCADGSLVEIFKSAGYNSKGLEISKDAVEIASAKGLDVQYSRLHTFPTNLPQSRVITAFDLLEHADKPGNVLREVYKNLEKNGYFVFSTLSVKRNDTTDYWFNHSLEHYVYYNETSLHNILTEIFGNGNFAFVEIEINGVAEFWGFGKKGKINKEAKIIDNIVTGAFDKRDAEGAYLVSLFYNQLSKFPESQEIIAHFKDEWSKDRYIQAEFYNLYFQGRFEKLLKVIEKDQYLISASNSVFWQAISFVKGEYAHIRETDIAKEYDQEIVNLREQLFKTRDELHDLKNSRVLGKIIKTRNRFGVLVQKAGGVKNVGSYLVKRTINKVRVITAPMVPGPVRRFTKRSYRKVRRHLATQSKNIVFEKIKNKKHSKGFPLATVVIPYYNRADTIDDTLNSLQKQTYQNFEVILVDDGSTDPDSIQKLKEIQYHKQKIKIIRQENQGVAAARNYGIRNALGKYIICLDSDDLLEPTYIEKSILILETDPEISLTYTHQQMFGIINELYKKSPYDALHLNRDNMVITAAVFRMDAWHNSGGYKSDIGYEDWEFWLSLSENGHWGRLLPEPLFKYRTSMQSRYVEDKDMHWNNIKRIHALHPNYRKNIKKLIAERKYKKKLIDPATALINMNSPNVYAQQQNNKENILIAIPWMTFGGAETLIINFCNEIKDQFNLSFVTGLESEHEWEYKFKEISPNVYHLANLFYEQELYLEFVSNYIKTREISILHIIHTSFMFDMLPELKKRHPKLKVVVTVFNDRAHFNESVDSQKYIDMFTTDNNAVAKHYSEVLEIGVDVVVIPNGINSIDNFNPGLFGRQKEREDLGINPEELAVFFIGRLSEEKNPDVFLQAAKAITESHNENVKFFVIGDGPMRVKVEKLVASIGSNNVTYLGYQSEIAKYLSSADIFVLPSAIEGFPLSILEAMAMRVCVIASDVGAVAEVIESGEDGFVVKPGSADEITETITMLSQNAELLTKVKTNAREKIESKYSNKVLGDNYKKMYKALLK